MKLKRISENLSPLILKIFHVSYSALKKCVEDKIKIIIIAALTKGKKEAVPVTSRSYRARDYLDVGITSNSNLKPSPIWWVSVTFPFNPDPDVSFAATRLKVNLPIEQV
uniref:Uncharacterized protein n=1 Tax=Romanomermis culicivorax TaxID=13658 RepID=A0A915HHY2_ROMCU